MKTLKYDNDDNSVLVNNSVIRVTHLEFDSISSLGLNDAEELPILINFPIQRRI